MHRITTLAAALALAAAIPATADPIYRCTLGGVPTFTDSPCGTDTATVVIDTRPTGLGGGLRLGEAAMLQRAYQEDAAALARKRAATERWHRHHVGYGDQLRIRNLERQRRDLVDDLDGGMSLGRGLATGEAIRGIDRQIEQLRAPKW